MRSLAGALATAQKAPDGVPYVKTVAYNQARGYTHLRFAQTYSGAEPDDEHDAVADATKFYRVRVRAGTPQYDIDKAGTWPALNATTTTTVIAVDAINAARVFVVYNRAAALYFRESTDQGSTFGSETLIISLGATPKAVGVAYKTAGGDLAVFWEESNAIKRIRRTSGTFGSAATWSLSAASVNGLDAFYSSDFLLAVTGVEVTTNRPTVWGLILGDGNELSVDTWGRFKIISQAESDELVTFQSPFLRAFDFTRVTYVEKFTGSPAYTRAMWTRPTPAGYSLNDWQWQDPAPINVTTAKGVALAKGATSPSTCFYSRPGQVLEAALSTVTLNMSADLIEATITEADGLRQRAELVFDNSSGAYAGPPSPLRLGRDVQLGIGYDINVSIPPYQSIVSWEYRRAGGRSLFVLHTQGNAYWLARSRPRTTITHASVKATDIAERAAARAGIDLFSYSPSTRATTFAMAWAIHPHQSSLDALEAVLELMADIFISQSAFAIAVHEPLAGDATNYDLTAQGHAVYEAQSRDHTAASLAEIIGEAVLGQAFDYARMDDDKPAVDRRRDPHATVYTDADAHAAARLRKATLRKDLGQLVIAPHCGLEIGDVLAYSDALVSPSAIKGRVTSIETRFRRRDTPRPVYEQRVALGGL